VGQQQAFKHAPNNFCFVVVKARDGLELQRKVLIRSPFGPSKQQLIGAHAQYLRELPDHVQGGLRRAGLVAFHLREYALKVTPAPQSLAMLLNSAEWWGKAQAAKEESQPVIPLAAETGVEVKGGEIAIHQGDRRYRIRGLGKNLSHELMKVNVLVARQEAFHVDTLDLYAARQRAAFIKQASGTGREGRRDPQGSGARAAKA
jgi:hypothetical protein